MANKCTICNGHRQRAAIDKAIVAGEPLRTIAFQFNTSHPTISRHKKHIKIKIQKAQDRKDQQVVKTHEKNEKRKIIDIDKLIDIASNLLAINYNMVSMANKQTNKEGIVVDKKTVMQATLSTIKCMDTLKGFLPSEPQKIDLTMKTEEQERQEIDDMPKDYIEKLLYGHIQNIKPGSRISA